MRGKRGWPGWGRRKLERGRKRGCESARGKERGGKDGERGRKSDDDNSGGDDDNDDSSSKC